MSKDTWKLVPNNAFQVTRHPVKDGFKLKLVGRDGYEFVLNKTLHTEAEYDEVMRIFNRRFISG